MSVVYVLEVERRVIYVGLTAGCVRSRFRSHLATACKGMTRRELAELDPFAGPYMGHRHRSAVMAKHKAGLCRVTVRQLTRDTDARAAAFLEKAAILLYMPSCNTCPSAQTASIVEAWVDSRQAR